MHAGNIAALHYPLAEVLQGRTGVVERLLLAGAQKTAEACGGPDAQYC